VEPYGLERLNREYINSMGKTLKGLCTEKKAFTGIQLGYAIALMANHTIVLYKKIDRKNGSFFNGSYICIN